MERRKVSSGEFHRGISQSSNVPLVHQVMKVLAMDVFRHASLLLVAAIAKDEEGAMFPPGKIQWLARHWFVRHARFFYDT